MKKLKSIIGRLRPAKPDKYYNKKDLERGTKIELEHTRNKKVAKRIAKHHLDEYKDYYNPKYGLPDLERKLEKNKKRKK